MMTYVQAPTSQWRELAGAFLRLGCVSFGGPIAHLGHLRHEFVHRRKWLDEAHYSDLVGLCQVLPGPASSQVVFALGMQRAGLWGALVASVCFTLPSALLMIAFGYGVASWQELSASGWLHGLKLAAVAVVAQAVWGMGKRSCRDKLRVGLCLASAAALILMPGALLQLGLIVLGGGIGWWAYRAAESSKSPAFAKNTEAALSSRGLALAALAFHLALLVLLPMLVAALKQPTLHTFDSFYRSGSFVFGGGHVVLPLLRAELIPKGWLSDAQFLAGYGAAQALPGPLFTFAAYLGTAMRPGPLAFLSGLWCLFGLLLPGWLVVGGALPFWQQIRAASWAQGALMGANATVVGVLLAAFYNPVLSEGVHQPLDVLAALLAFWLLETAKLPSWCVVAGMALLGFGFQLL